LSADAATAVPRRTAHPLDLLNFPLADVRDGPDGRFNVSLGAATTVWGVGAALSNILAGWIVVAAGYHAAFISLGALAGAGLTLYLVAMPETGPNAAKRVDDAATTPPPNGGGRG
jgi:MFS family permease